MSAAESLTAATTGGRNPFHTKISGHRGGEPVAARKRIGRMPARPGWLTESAPFILCRSPACGNEPLPFSLSQRWASLNPSALR